MSFGGKFFTIISSPPVAQVADRIRLAARVVKAVANFVADDGNDAAVIYRIVRSGIEERWLQNRCGKYNFIEPRVVIRVHRLRRHAPLFTVNGVTELGDIAFAFRDAHALQITDEIIPGDCDGRIIAPLGGVANLRIHRRQLGLRFFFGGRTHPVKPVDAVTECSDQIRHQFLHARFIFGREMFLDVTLAERLAERAFNQTHATLP